MGELVQQPRWEWKQYGNIMIACLDISYLIKRGNENA